MDEYPFCSACHEDVVVGTCWSLNDQMGTGSFLVCDECADMITHGIFADLEELENA